jgi:hypothetical protein
MPSSATPGKIGAAWSRLKAFFSSMKVRPYLWTGLLLCLAAVPPFLYLKYPALVEASGFGLSVKLFAAVFAAGFGILGVGADTRISGKLTTKGWVALCGIVVAGEFALAATLYDYSSGKKKDEQDLARNTQLLTSVRRGIYPVKDLTATFKITLHGSFSDLNAYKVMLSQKVSDPFCKAYPKVCIPYGNTDEPNYYGIRPSSPLFPDRKRYPRLVSLLENLHVELWLYRPVRAEERAKAKGNAYKMAGELNLDWPKALPSEVELEYHQAADELSFIVAQLPLDSKQLPNSGVYSLVDFVPGVIAAEAGADGGKICPQGSNLPECFTGFLEPVLKSDTVDLMRITFAYPKSIEFSNEYATTCEGNDRKSLVQRLTEDIDSGYELAFRTKPEPDKNPQQLCRDVEAARKADPY